ncbi:hypothetical protein ZTR_07084 [Talaromyces verruculosus]|nr:hypothetical protein ZTR_07084 [Talaromyces verruculosus]
MESFLGPKKIKFKCIIEDDQNGSIEFDRSEQDDLTLKEFRTWVQNWYSIQGLVSLYYSGLKLTNLMSPIGEVLPPDGTLIIRADKNTFVASGGVGMGARVVSTTNEPAIAEGGYGTGGSYVDGVLRGGRGVGGDGKGDSGRAGEGFGGTASTPHGEAESGRSTGGQFEKSQA